MSLTYKDLTCGSSIVFPFPAVIVSPAKGEANASARGCDDFSEIDVVDLQRILTRFGLLYRLPIVARPMKRERGGAVHAQDDSGAHEPDLAVRFPDIELFSLATLADVTCGEFLYFPANLQADGHSIAGVLAYRPTCDYKNCCCEGRSRAPGTKLSK